MNHSSFLRSVGRRLARRRFLAIGACLAACSAASMAQECALYPIALSADTVQGLTPGTVLVDVYNGNQPGNFGWLTWGGSPSVPTLVRSLTPPGDSSSYANPDNPSDHEINRGDWVEGKPGVSNSKNVRDTLDALKDIDIIVPAWDAVRGQGNNADYRVAGFVRIRILSYSLPGQNRITARLIGFVTCGEENQAPVTDAGEDQTVVITNAAVLNGSVTDDGLPALSEVRSQWSVVSGPGSASFADPLAPATTATFSDIGTYTLRLTADDGELTASDDVAITVLPPNKPPVALPQDVETDEDVPADITLAGTDPDQDPLTFLVVDEPTNGVLSGSAPDMTYTPNPDYFGQDSFTFKAHDGQTDSVPAIVSITVNPVNDTPVADPQSLTTDEDMSLTITLAASDVENDPLTYAVAIFPDHGVLSGSAPDLLYAPNPDWHGTDTFSFVVSDLSATSAVSIVAIHVASVNDTPTAGAQTVSLDEDSTAAVMLSGSDADDDPLSFELLSAPSNGVLEGTAPNLVYRPADNFYGSDCFAFRVSDGLVYSDTASVMLAVQSVNDTPVANPQEVTTDEDVSVGVTLTGSDVENDALFFEIVSSPANGDLSGTLPDLLYIPTADFHGDDDFRFAVCDGSATSVPALVHVTIVSVNDPPAATAGAVTVMEDEAIAIVLTGSDPDGDPITFAVLDGPAHGSLSGVPPDLTYVPAADFFGSDSLGFTVGDGILTSAVTTVTIDVVPVNDAPVAHSQTLTTEEDIPLQIVLNATDVDNGVLTYAIMEEPAHGVLSGTAPDLLYTPDPDYNGLDALAFQASDGQTDSVPAVVSITVNPINDPPVALPQDVSTDEDVALNITLSGSDAENDALAFAVVTGPTNGVLVGTAPDLEYAPATDFHGEDSLVFVVSDASATSAPAVVRIVVISVNDPPVAEAQLVTTDERTPVGITLTGSDMDNDPLTFAIIEAPLGGSLSGAAPDVTYTPDNGFWGSDSLTFEVSDGFATSAPATVALDVRPLPRCRTYTTEADFQEGAFLNTDTLGRDQLQLRNSMEAFNSIWIAVSTKGTIVRIDTETGEVKGEYWSSPEGQPKNPSRTTVDLNGNVWTANRAGNSVVHIAVPESGRWIDKNNNGQLDTSTGYGDILPWPNTGGVDTDGGVDTAQDELIIHYVKTTSSGTRHVSVDSNNNVWVSGTGNRRWDLIDGNVGEIIRREPSVGFGGYGGLIDPNGVIWSSGNGLLRWNTALPLIGFNGGNWAGYGHAAYGIGIDSHGNIWVSQWGGGKVLKYAPDGMLLGVFDHHGYRAQGVAVDGDDCVWVAHSLSDGHTVAKLRNDGTWVGNVTVGSGPTGIAVDNNGKVWVSLYRDGRAVRIDPHAGPIGADGETPVGEVDLRTRHLGGALYNYSDMTGSTLTGVPEIGSWSAVFDSGLPGAEWGRITWNARVHNDGLLDVRVATGDDPDTLESFQHVTLSSNQLTGTGRYAKIMILFDRAASGHSPEVYDVTIGTKGCQEETIVPAWGVYAGDDEQVDWPGSFKLNGSVWHNDFGFDTNVPVEWTVLSGPGAVTFEDAAAKATFCDFSEKGVYALRLQAASGAEVRQDDLTLNVVPVNRPPWVYVGPDRAMRSFATPMALQATARDDGLPQGSTMSLQWTQEMGPGDTQFTDPHSTNTTVAFTNAGIYLLELTADDTELAYTDWLEARIAMLCTVKDVPGIVQWWPGNRNTREWVRGNDINLFNDSAYAPAKVSYGFSFNGNSDFASAFAHESANVGAGTGFTLEMWIKPDSARDGRIFEWCDITHQGVYFRQEADYNRFQVNLVDTNGATHWIDFDNALTYTGFQHIAFTYDKSSGQACLYKNAVLTHSVSVGSIALRTEGDIYIGGSVAPRFKGVMDEVTLYNRPLYADEILAVYVSDFVGKCPLDNNLAPVVDAGPDLALHEAGDSAWLAGSVTDDELPPMSDIYSEWTKVDGPGDVLFADPFSPQTSAEFSQPGIYVLRLTADDGCILVSDDVQVRVATPCEVDGPDGLAALWRANFSPRDEVADLLLHLASGVTYTNGRVSGGFSFDGSGSAWTEACSGLNIAADGEFTVEAWVNARAPTSTYPGLFSYGGGMYAGVRSPSILRINLADTAGNDHYMDVTDYFASQYDRFIHFALTYDLADGLARVYRNGIIVHEERLGSFTPDTRRDFALGAGGYCGILDEFSLYSRALEPDEVYAIFAAGEAGKCPVDDNEDPQVSAGPDLRLPEISQAVTLQGEVTDDGRPTNTTLRTSWSVVSGPGTVTFADASSPQTPATFSVPGTYMLNLTASDGSIRAGDKVQVRVEQPCSVIAPTGLTAWWPVNFDVEEASGGPALMLINGASFTNGAVSGALHLNGTGVAMARACPALDIGAEASFTIEAWVNVANRPGLGEWRRFLAWSGGGMTLEHHESRDMLRIALRDVAGTTHYVDALDYFTGRYEQFVHVAVTYSQNSGLARIYHDGILVHEENVGSFAVKTQGNLYFGGFPIDTHCFVGILDDLSLYNRALSHSEIHEIFAARDVGKCPLEGNDPPVVFAGHDLCVVELTQPAQLNGQVADDGRPLSGYLRRGWSVLSGPGTVAFGDPADPRTTASFDQPGIYILELTACDGAAEASDILEVRVDAPCTVSDPPGLTAWWPLNFAVEEASGGPALMLINGVSFANGAVSGALHLNGTGVAMARACPALDIGAEASFTIEAWVNVANRPGLGEWRHFLVWSGGGMALEHHELRDMLRVALRDVSGTTHYVDALDYFTGRYGQFVHVAVTYSQNSGLARIYRDGILVHEENVGSFAVKTQGDLYFGGVPIDTHRFVGALDEVSLYNLALSHNEIHEIFAASHVGKCPLDGNQPPGVCAGSDGHLADLGDAADLNGWVTDDGLPLNGSLQVIWTLLSGPGNVTFADAESAETTAMFDQPGIYILQLSACDGAIEVSDTLEVRVASPCTISDLPGLTAWWRGNHSAANAGDGPALQLCNGASFTNGVVSGGFLFNGTGVAVAAACSAIDIASEDAFTIEAWVKAFTHPPLGGFRNVLDWRGGGLFVKQGRYADRLVIGLRNPGGAWQYVDADNFFSGRYGDFIHLAVTYTRGSATVRVYRDGVLFFSKNVGALDPNTYKDLWVGGYLTGDDRFSGVLDEITLYNRALSADRIYGLYAAGQVGKCPLDGNKPPIVFAGLDQVLSSTSDVAALSGQIADDGLPEGSEVRCLWSVVSGPGLVSLDSSNSTVCTASFDQPGIYVLRLTASDGAAVASDVVEIHVAVPCQAPVSGLAAWWSGNYSPFDRVNGTEMRLYGGTSYTNAKVSAGFQFGGLGSASASASPALNVGADGAFTFEAWLNNRTAVSLDVNVFQWSGGVYAGPRTGSHLLRVNLREISGVNHYFDVANFFNGYYGTFMHFALTYDSANGLVQVYRNGVRVSQASVGSFIPYTQGTFSIAGPGLQGVLDEVSLYNRALTTGEIQAIYNSGSQGRCPLPPINTAPQVIAGANQQVHLPNAQITLQGQVIDDGLPEGSEVHGQWSMVDGPHAVSFGCDTCLVTTISLPMEGDYTVRLTADDGQRTNSDTTAVTVLSPVNFPPTVSAGPDQITPINTPVTLSGSVTDDGLPQGSEVECQWFQVSGPGTAVFDDRYSPATPVTVDFPGTYVLRLTAGDTELSAYDDVAVTAYAAPSITLISPAQGSMYTTNDVIPFVADALDSDGTIATVEFFCDGSKIGDGVQDPGTIRYRLDLSAGSFPLDTPLAISARATDNDGHQDLSEAVGIAVVGDPAAVVVAIESPEDAARITAPIDIIGTVRLPGLDNWRLEYRLRDARLGEDQSWLTLGSGTAPVFWDELGHLDPTLLPNGAYELRLIGADTDGRMTISETVTVTVDGNMKVGLFTLSFEELSVPLAGIPIQVIRTYDSRSAIAGRVGDFGYGWTLSLKDVRLQKGRRLDDRWEQEIIGASGYGLPLFEMRPGRERIVTIAFPDNQVFRFRAVFDPDRQVALPILSGHVVFEALPGTHGTLEVAGNNEVEVTGDIPYWDPFGGGVGFGYVDLMDLDTYEEFNPTRFRFTTQEGMVFVLDENDGLISITDANGNQVVYDSAGIHHSSGESVQFIRDSQGRITQILDPAGNALTYGYSTNGDLIAFTDRTTNTTSFSYLPDPSNPSGSSHLLQDITDPRGIRAIRTEYDESGRMISQTDADGNPIVFTHDIPNRTETVRDRLGNVTTHEYDDCGNVVRTVDALGGVTTYTYDEFDNKLTETDPLGHTTTWTYDEYGNQTSERDPLGNTTYTDYNSRRQPTRMEDAKGNVTLFRYDASGNLTNMVDALANTTTYKYDSRGNLVREVDALGNVTSNRYDTRGRLLDRTDAKGIVTSYTYDSNGNQLTRRTWNPISNFEFPISNIYDSANRLIETINPDGTSTRTEYNSLGKEIAHIDELGRRTEMQYNARGELIRTIYPDGGIVGVGYDLEGRKVAETNQAGFVTEYEYDALGRLTATFHPDGAIEETIYDAAGDVQATVDARGNRTTYGYDDAGRRNAETNALGQVTKYQYDQVGNLVAVTDARGNTTEYVSDALNRRVQTILPDGACRSTLFDALGRIVAETDEAGLTTTLGYDPLGRLTAVTNAVGGVTRYEYDDLGNQTAQIDANGRVTRLEYDSRNRKIRRTLPMGQIETMAYDAVGNLTNRVDFNGKTTVFAYDPMNQLLRKTPDASFAAPAVEFSYDLRGLRMSMSDASGTTTYSYDQRGRLVEKGTPFGTLSYSYDLQGNLSTTRSSNAKGTLVAYSYDALNRVRAVADANGLTMYHYDEVGNLRDFILPNGVNQVYTYNPVDRLTNVVVNHLVTPIESYNYALAATGHQLAVQEGNGREVTYRYDNLYRLTRETILGASPLGEVGYGLDPVGNRLAMTSTVFGIPSATYTYDQNDRLGSDSYDANGNTTAATIHDSLGGTDTAFTYTYDFENRLISASSAFCVVSVLYDGDGNRVQKTVTDAFGTRTTRYLVDQNNPTGYSHVLEELDASNNVVVAYTVGLDLISQTRITLTNEITHYFGYDGHGSVRFLTDTNGYTTDRHDFSAFGNLIAQSGSTPNNYLYAGEQYDTDLGVYFLRARYMATGRGRFLTADRSEISRRDPSTMHRYVYAKASPTRHIDPEGLQSMTIAEQMVVQKIQAEQRTSEAGVKAEVGVRTSMNVTTKVPRPHSTLQTVKGFERHHVIEKRCLDYNKVLQQYYQNNPNNMPSVHAEIARHHEFTARWVQALPKKPVGGAVPQYSIEQIMAAAEKVYFDAPELLSFTQRLLSSLL